jgi:hypothetical protein
MSVAADRRRQAADRVDFERLVEEFGFTLGEVEAQSRSLADYRPVPPRSMHILGVWIRPSKLDRMGLFARREFRPGSALMIARVDGFRTQAGRYGNHSRDPNAEMVAVGEGVILLASTRWIVQHDEITTNYRANLRLLGVLPVAERA